MYCVLYTTCSYNLHTIVRRSAEVLLTPARVSEPWDYVSFKHLQSELSEGPGGELTTAGTMAGTHPDVSYQVAIIVSFILQNIPPFQVASKHELEVIYEGVNPRGSRTVTIAISVLAVVLVLGAGASVALWGAGLLGGDTQSELSEQPLDLTQGVTLSTESTLSVSSSTSTSTYSIASSTPSSRSKPIKVQQLPIEGGDVKETFVMD